MPVLSRFKPPWPHKSISNTSGNPPKTAIASYGTLVNRTRSQNLSTETSPPQVPHGGLSLGVRLHIYIYTHIYIYICIYVCMYVCMYGNYICIIWPVGIENLYMRIIYIYIYIYIYIHTYIHTYIHMYSDLYTLCDASLASNSTLATRHILRKRSCPIPYYIQLYDTLLLYHTRLY